MRQEHGFSLIEALVALLVLSIGLIGVAAMQLKALQSANAGYQRSVASVAAVDAQERLWAQLAASFEAGQTCEDIDTSAVQAEWREHWFQGDDATPLRGSSPSQSSIKKETSSDGCRLRVRVAVGGSDENSETFDYTFSLPRIVRIESTP